MFCPWNSFWKPIFVFLFVYFFIKWFFNPWTKKTLGNQRTSQFRKSCIHGGRKKIYEVAYLNQYDTRQSRHHYMDSTITFYKFNKDSLYVKWYKVWGITLIPFLMTIQGTYVFWWNFAGPTWLYYMVLAVQGQCGICQPQSRYKSINSIDRLVLTLWLVVQSNIPDAIVNIVKVLKSFRNAVNTLYTSRRSNPLQPYFPRVWSKFH